MIIKGGYIMLEFHQLPSSEEVLKFLTGSVTKQGFKGLQETITKISVVLSE